MMPMPFIVNHHQQILEIKSCYNPRILKLFYKLINKAKNNCFCKLILPCLIKVIICHSITEYGVCPSSVCHF